MKNEELKMLENQDMMVLRKRLYNKLKHGYITELQRFHIGKYINHLFEVAYGLGYKDGQNKAWSAWKSEFADNGWMDHSCVKCGYTINTDVHVQVDYDFCPGCGAPMANGCTFSEKYSEQN